MPASSPPVLDHHKLYRLPWTLPDNVIAWLEPTAKCNLSCEGCYRANVNEHKSLGEIGRELDIFASQRKFDGVSIAGGDPLTHPEVIDIVRLVAERGYKPVLNTNGLALEEGLLRDLKKAGLVGLTFHVDSKQGRPGWRGKTEVETNALRLQLAELVAKVGGLSVAFNATIYPDTLHEVPELVAWAQEHIELVHVMVFILYRSAMPNQDFDYFAGGEKVDMNDLVYGPPEGERPKDITAPDVVAKIRERFPDFEPAAYLNGTEQADSFKWLLATRVGTRKRIHGYLGSKVIEASQVLHHLIKGRYFAYIPPSGLSRGKWLLGLWPFDSSLRRILRSALTDPTLLWKRLHLQSIMVIQPIDLLEDGRQNMCDGCPDMTVWDDKIAWSCRLEECLSFGCFVHAVPKNGAAAAPAVQAAPSLVKAEAAS